MKIHMFLFYWCRYSNAMKVRINYANLVVGILNTQPNENVFKVSFHSNNYTRMERVEDFALLKSAELTLEHRYQYVTVINESSDSPQHRINKLVIPCKRQRTIRLDWHSTR